MPARRPQPPAWTPTPLQRLVLAATVRHGPKEAAHRLERSESTVLNTVRRMRQRAGVDSTAQLIYLGAASGWLIVPDLDRACRVRRSRSAKRRQV